MVDLEFSTEKISSGLPPWSGRRWIVEENEPIQSRAAHYRGWQCGSTATDSDPPGVGGGTRSTDARTDRVRATFSIQACYVSHISFSALEVGRWLPAIYAGGAGN